MFDNYTEESGLNDPLQTAQSSDTKSEYINIQSNPPPKRNIPVNEYIQRLNVLSIII